MKTTTIANRTRNNATSGMMMNLATFLAAALLISLSANAQNLNEENRSRKDTNELALSMIDREEKVAASAAAVVAEIFDMRDEADAPMMIESWMVDDAFFGNYRSFSEEAEMDAPLMIESWMTDQDFYLSKYPTEKDAELDVEAWMCDANFYLK